MAPRTVPPILAITFRPDEHDSWGYLAQRMMYLPPGVEKAGGVAAIGLTGNLGPTGPLGIYAESDSAILVMNGPEVARRNKLTEVAYSNLDLAVADNFRVLRRVRERKTIPYMFVAPIAVAAMLGNRDFAAYMLDKRRYSLDKSEGGFADYVAIAMNTSSGRQEELYYQTFTMMNKVNSFDAFVAAMNRFAPLVVGAILDKLKDKPDNTTLFYWGEPEKLKSQRLLIKFQRGPGGGMKYVLTLGELRRGYQEMLAGRGADAMRGALTNDLAQSLGRFEEEVEWIANPTPDPRARGYSVTLNIPPNSVLFTVDRSFAKDRNHIAHVTAHGLWVVNISSQIDEWLANNGQRIVNVLAYITEFLQGMSSVDYVHKMVNNLEADIYFPSEYWTIAREA